MGTIQRSCSQEAARAAMASVESPVPISAPVVLDMDRPAATCRSSLATQMPMASGVSRHVFASVQLTPNLTLNIKLEGLTPGGSIKDKAAREMISDGLARGVISKDTTVVESTSGNMGIALARRCAALGLPFTAIVDPNATSDAIAAMKAAGATIILVDTRDAQGGFLESRILKVRELCARDQRYWWPNQYANPANANAHEKTTGPEIADSFESIAHLYIGAGTCGTLTGTGCFFKRHRPDTRIVAVDSEGSVTFGLPAGNRYIPGLGASRRPENVDLSVIDDLQIVSEADAIVACRWLARRHGLLLGGSTGSVVAGAMLHQRRVRQPGVCVTISPDGGEKYLPTVYHDAWVEQRFGRDPIVRGAAEELEI